MIDNYHFKDLNLLFTRDTTGYFIPAYENYDSETGEADEISKGTLLYDFLAFIKYSERKLITGGTNAGKVRDGFAEIYQYLFAYRALKITERMDREAVMAVFARQSGKSWIARKVLAFLLIFYTHHYDLGIHDRFYVIFANFKKDMVTSQLLKLVPEITKAIECYNDLYPNAYIEWKRTPRELKVDTTLVDNTEMIQFNRVIDGKSFPYSQLDMISLNDRVVSAGLSAHVLYMDEMQDLDYNWISKQAIPFLNSCSGVIIGTGTAKNDPNCALYGLYHSKAVKDDYKMVLDWETITEYKKFISQDHANTYKRAVEMFLLQHSEKSEIFQTEYMCNMQVDEHKFLTISKMDDNQMFHGDIESNISHYTDSKVYRIGSLDPALNQDRCVMTLGLTGFTENSTWVELKNLITIKELGRSIDPETIMNETIKICNENKLDFLIVDNTASQRYLTIPLYKRMKVETNTQIIPFDSAGFNEKVKMCKFNEGLIYQQTYKIPKLIYRDQDKNYNILLDELISLEYEKRTGGYTLRAPKNLNDDFAMSFLMLGYCLNYTKMLVDYNRYIIVGTEKYRVFLRKNEDKVEFKEQEWWQSKYATIL